MLIELVLIYLIYFLIVIIGTYYVTLFNSKDVFTKDEIKSISPYISLLTNKINENYPITSFFAVLSVSSCIGIIFPMLFKHWFVNSSILLIILFFMLPIIKTYLENSQELDENSYSQVISNLLHKFMEVILLGFGAGLGTALIYNWRILSDIYSLFFMVNIVIISIFIGYIINNLAKE